MDERPRRHGRSRSRVGAWVVALCLLTASAVATSQSAVTASTVDGQYLHTGPISAGTPLELVITGRGGVPAGGVDSVVLNVTVTNPSAKAFLVVWPTGQPRPESSNLNFVPGQTVPNLVVVKVGAQGKVSIANPVGTVDVVIDVAGWFPVGGSYTGLTPARILDTRHTTPVSASTPLEVQVAGRGGVPPTGVDSVVLNVTVAKSTHSSYLSVWPTGVAKPGTSSLNFGPEQTVPNLAVAKLGTGGKVSIATEVGAVHVMVDVAGWFPVGGAFTGLVPTRVADTRTQGLTVDGFFRGLGPVGDLGALELVVTGRGGVPAAGVDSVVMNVTVTNPSAASYLAVWPTGSPRPNSSNLDFRRGQITSNLVVAKVGPTGSVSIANGAGKVNVMVDVVGWFPAGGGSFQSLPPARLADTRRPPSPPPPPRPPPPTPTYPTGHCDSIAPGMEGFALQPGQQPSKVVQIGTSVQGRPIWAEYWGPEQPSSTVVVIGQIHGNECAPLRVVRAVRVNPPTRYGIWLIPTMNPDGHAAYKRENANGRDLNTDGRNWREPETRALMDFTAFVRPVLTVHVHSPNGFVGWFGSGTYYYEQPGRSGAALSGPIAQYIANRSALRFSGAGIRTDKSRWFLWQGQLVASPGHETLLVEVHAVAHSEVPNARPRPRTRTVAQVDEEAALVLAALDRYIP